MLRILYSKAIQYHLANLEKQHAIPSYIKNHSFKDESYENHMHNEPHNPYCFVQEPQFTGFL